MTGIPWGDNGWLMTLRPDHDRLMCLCGPVDDGYWWRWQRGCPLTGLPTAAPWRPGAELESATAEETS